MPNYQSKDKEQIIKTQVIKCKYTINCGNQKFRIIPLEQSLNLIQYFRARFLTWDYFDLYLCVVVAARLDTSQVKETYDTKNCPSVTLLATL